MPSTLPSSLLPADTLPPMGEVKECAGCHKLRGMQCFTVYKLGVREYRHSRCNKCRAEANKLTPARRRNREIIAAAKHKPCEDCRQTFLPVFVELLPRGPVNRTIDQAWRWMNGPQFQKLVDQHETVCENCRRKRMIVAVSKAFYDGVAGPLLLAEFERAARVKSADSQRA